MSVGRGRGDHHPSSLGTVQPWRISITRRPLAAVDHAAVTDLVAEAAAADGAKPLSDAALLASPAGARHLLARRERDPGADHLGAVASEASLLGYCHIDPTTGTAELVVAPSARGHGLGGALADQAVAMGATGAWAHADLPAARALAHARGMAVERRLLLMTLATAADAWPHGWQGEPTLRLRRYRGADDDEAILAVNAAAFADLPDQGGWTAADLAARTGADWFRAGDLLLLIDPRAADGARLEGGRLVGFHWTKVHPDGSGEVYVVGLDPAYQGRGLGPPLTRAGLAHLAAAGCREVGLFVDSANAAALALYRSLGFVPARQDVLYRLADRWSPHRVVAPGASRSPVLAGLGPCLTRF